MHVELSIHFKRMEGQDKGGEFLHLCRSLLVYVFIKVMNDELFSDLRACPCKNRPLKFS